MIVSIIGRPNVGKSTLFNRIAGERISIVSSVSGTTRDRVSTNTNWNGKNFILIDTGGIDQKSDESFQASITDQALNAINDSDKLIVSTDKGRITSGSNSTTANIKYKSDGVDSADYKLKKANKTGKWLQVKFEDMDEDIKALAFIYRLRSIK